MPRRYYCSDLWPAFGGQGSEPSYDGVSGAALSPEASTRLSLQKPKPVSRHTSRIMKVENWPSRPAAVGGPKASALRPSSRCRLPARQPISPARKAGLHFRPPAQQKRPRAGRPAIELESPALKPGPLRPLVGMCKQSLGARYNIPKAAGGPCGLSEKSEILTRQYL